MVLKDRKNGRHLRDVDDVLPREGHPTQLFHMVAHLKKEHNSQMAFHPSYPLVDEEHFK